MVIKKQTAAQKKKVEEYKTKSKAMDKTKKGVNPKAFVAGSKLGAGVTNLSQARKELKKAYESDLGMLDSRYTSTGRTALKKAVVSARSGVSAGQQEKAAVARGASKRKAIVEKASNYQKSRGKKK